MIGLMTPFRVSNYGTKLQAYAVQQCVRSMGYDAEIIDYVPRREAITVKNFPRKCFYKMIRQRYADHRAAEDGPAFVQMNRKIRNRALEAFDQEYLCLSERVETWDELKAYSNRYNAVVCGSDQVFNPVNLGAKCYFLEWVSDDVRRIALSPSFGVDRLPMLLKPLYARKLKRFDALSVREESGRRIMNMLGLNWTERTLDPTLLLEKAAWNDLADFSKVVTRKGYVLGYFLGDRPLGREVLRRLGRNRRIVLLPHIKGYVPEDEMEEAERMYEVGVPEFLNLIRNADCVVTDSFHAAAFSVMFHRSFYTVERHVEHSYSTNSRVSDFLSMIGLEDRMISDCAKVEEPVEIDYQPVEEILAREREKTEAYIRSSLAGAK